MTYEPLEDVVLTHDIPEHGLTAGDLGTVVHVYDSKGVEVEFGTASGKATAVLTPDGRRSPPPRGSRLLHRETVRDSNPAIGARLGQPVDYMAIIQRRRDR